MTKRRLTNDEVKAMADSMGVDLSPNPILQELTFIECGPNRTCDHDMSGEEPLTDEDGRVCGSTAVCIKCGETAFNLSMWSD